MNKKLHALYAAIPLLLSPLLFYVLAEGHLNLGGGEKDILFVVPWFIGSIIFMYTAWVQIAKGESLQAWLGRSLLYTVIFLLLLSVLLPLILDLL